LGDAFHLGEAFFLATPFFFGDAFVLGDAFFLGDSFAASNGEKIKTENQGKVFFFLKLVFLLFG